MISVSTIFTISGFGIALGIIDQILKSMGKESYGSIVSLLGITILSIFTFKQINVLFDVMNEFIGYLNNL